MRWLIHCDENNGRWYVCRIGDGLHDEAFDATTWQECCEWLRRNCG